MLLLLNSTSSRFLTGLAGSNITVSSSSKLLFERFFPETFLFPTDFLRTLHRRNPFEATLLLSPNRTILLLMSLWEIISLGTARMSTMASSWKFYIFWRTNKLRREFNGSMVVWESPKDIYLLMFYNKQFCKLLISKRVFNSNLSQLMPSATKHQNVAVIDAKSL